MKVVDLTEKKFGILTVLGRAENVDGEVRWNCRCSCPSAKVFSVRGRDLRSGNTKSCGCFAKERKSAVHKTHGYSRCSREYSIWEQLKNRCLNDKTPRFKDYGGRGITVCERWRNSFEFFLQDMGPAPLGYTIERQNNDKGYAPGNCVWASRKSQANNRRSNRLLTFNNRTQTLAQWCDELGIRSVNVQMRLARGWSLESALLKPIRR